MRQGDGIGCDIFEIPRLPYVGRKFGQSNQRNPGLRYVVTAHRVYIRILPLKDITPEMRWVIYSFNNAFAARFTPPR